MSAWRRHRSSWLGPVLFAVLGLIALGSYYLAFNGKARALERRLENHRQSRDELHQQLQMVAESLAMMDADDQRIEQLFGTIEDVPRRLTRYIRLVHQLTERSGLEISGSVGFGSEENEDFGLAERTMDFDVRGDYDSFRRFINMLELSEEFLAVRDVRVQADRDNPNQLRVGISVSTMFAADPPVPEA